ncbi:MAG: hypothetical protein NTX79_08335 [Candidatus Micrarchaeota archaeon]|nr:hypothetical protein [Candidatus Micrarchaeota archaeon]
MSDSKKLKNPSEAQNEREKISMAIGKRKHPPFNCEYSSRQKERGSQRYHSGRHG